MNEGKGREGEGKGREGGNGFLFLLSFIIRPFIALLALGDSSPLGIQSVHSKPL
jgi:hypothetical protein